MCRRAIVRCLALGTTAPIVALVMLAFITAGTGLARAAPGPPCLWPPIGGRVIDPFREPACPFCAGNRGLELATSPGDTVVAAAGGAVRFAGTVAGARYVVVEHRDGFRTTYGNLATVAVRAGVSVEPGTTLGTAGPRMFFGLRSGDRYVDPAPHLARATARPQLVPLNGRNRRAPRPARWSCPGDGGADGDVR
jgi:murein DD-endopeptidase MepM/ murein hydrolase activator NlpD